MPNKVVIQLFLESKRILLESSVCSLYEVLTFPFYLNDHMNPALKVQ